jgi:branched-chain amino acid transport system substrate-binding protein
MTAFLAFSVAITVLGVTEAGAQQNPPVNQPGVTDKTIRVGGIATESNDPTGLTWKSSFDGVAAYFDYINRTQGGVYGRKLELASKRDDQLANNRQEVQGLLSEDNVFAVLPVATALFTGVDLLVQNNIPTFGWDVNAEWGSEDHNPGPANLFGQGGSFINFSSPGPNNFPQAWLPKKLGRTRVGMVAYAVPQSADVCRAQSDTIKRFDTAKVVFTDTSQPFGNPDYSVQVAQMVKDKVDFVIACLDINGAMSLAREMKKQGLDATKLLQSSYVPDVVQKNAQFLDKTYMVTDVTPLETKPKPAGLKLYEKWIKRSGGARDLNSLVGWVNADLFVTGLKAAGPDFTRQKVIDGINQIKDYKAGGILAGIDWTTAHRVASPCYTFVKVVDGKFKPAFGEPGKPFVCFPADLQTMPKNPELAG